MDVQSAAPQTLCMSKITLAAGSTTTLSNTGTTVYGILGKAYSKSAMTNAATPTTDAATGNAFNPVPANYGSIYMIGFDASGNLLAVQGTVVPLDGNGAFINAPMWGAVPNTFCPVGYVVIKAGSTASSSPGWLFGTNNMSGVTGITYTFGDLIGITGRPQIS